MKIVAAKCPNCGANIEVDSNSNTTKCEYCNSSIVVKEAIEKLKIEISGNVEVSNLPKFKNLVKLADRYYADGKVFEADEYYAKALELNPDDCITIIKQAICLDRHSEYFNFPDITSALKTISNILADKENSESEFNECIKKTIEYVKFIQEGELDTSQYKKASDRYKPLQGCLDCYVSILTYVNNNEKYKKEIYINEIKILDYLIDNFKYTSFSKTLKNSFKTERDLIVTELNLIDNELGNKYKKTSFISKLFNK